MIYGTLECPICKIERNYKTPTGYKLAKQRNSPCRSCANSLSSGGKGNVRERGCFECGHPEIAYNSLCRECHKKRSKKYYKETYRWAKYGLDGPIKIECCEICDSKDDLVIDHCHDTKKVRGILCRTCNLGIGSLKEDKELIRKALIYAERTFN